MRTKKAQNLSKDIQNYLVNDINHLSGKEQLNEWFWDDWTLSDVGHGTLDAVAMISSVFPGVGTTVSTIADISNAVWYYREGQTITAALYLIMSIPIVGDVVALPIQLVLKVGGKGIMKIPGIKKAIAVLLEKSPFVKKALREIIGKTFVKDAEAITAKGVIGKEVSQAVGKATSQAGTAAETKAIAESAEKLIDDMVKANKKGGVDEAIKVLESSLTKESEKGTVSLGSKISKEEVGQLSKKIEKELGEKIGTKAEKEAAGTFAGKLSTWGAKQLGKLSKQIGKHVVGRTAADIEKKSSSSDAPKSKTKEETNKKCYDDKLEKGCVGDNVRVIQGYLKNLGYNTPVDGTFGGTTEAAVKKLQKDNKITETGIVEYFTLAKIEQLLTVGATTREQLPLPGQASTFAGSDLFESKKFKIIRKRNIELENLVFERLVKQCR